MDKEYVFPKDNWYLKFTEEERPIVDNWRINIIKFSHKPCLGNYINYRGMGIGRNVDGTGELITFEQFKQYVLNIQEPIIEQQPEDLSYLIDFLKQKNIN